ncbi:MAG: glycerophosphoryl diester phosphodiesterase membrane domain-containing protein [Candidatus Dormibacteraeota bacterium]|nr:glycerophosphoryl diester phosphodiesterase membrane domain-containing protein [Candidatus Dormibacteraeota bacterium]
MGSGRFRSMGVGELLDGVFSLYRRNFVLIAAISAIVQVPYAVILFVLYQLSGFSALQNQLGASQGRTITPQQAQDVLGSFGTILLVTSLLALVQVFVVQPLAVAATTRAVSDRYLDRPATIRDSYASALRRLGSLIVQSLILIFGSAVVLVAAVFLIALLAAGIGSSAIPIAILLVLGLIVLFAIVFVRTSLAVPAIVLERLSGWGGLARSWNLVRDLFWRMLGIRLLLALITGIISGVIGVILSLAGTPLDVNGRFIVQQVATDFATVFVSPVTYIAVTLLYYDARIRKEAFDIEMLAQSL